jgi:spore germination protein YaaH
MRRVFILTIFFALLLAPPASAAAPRAHRQPNTSATPTKRASRDLRPQLTTLMYLINSPASIASFREHADEISIIAPQSFSMDAEGFIGGEVPAEVLAVAAEKHVAVMPLVINRRFNQPLMHTVLDNAASRARAIRYLLYYALRDGYIGFQFDYENIHYDYRNRFSLFFSEAAREFHRHGLLLSIAVVGRFADAAPTPGNGYDNWSGVYDYAALGRDADFLSVMAYSEHDANSAPGPVAGYPWVQKIADYTLQQLPARKVSLGVPLYGCQWTAVAPANSPASAASDGKTDIALAAPKPPAKKWTGHSGHYVDLAARMQQAAVVWDPVEQANHASFSDSGPHSEIWLEDARSLSAKIALATQLHLPGISAWVLGVEDPAIWTLLQQYRIVHPRVPKVQGTVEERARAAARKLGSQRPIGQAR